MKTLPVTRADKPFDQLGKARYFSEIDIKSGYDNVWIAANDVEKTAFIKRTIILRF